MDSRSYVVLLTPLDSEVEVRPGVASLSVANVCDTFTHYISASQIRLCIKLAVFVMAPKKKDKAVKSELATATCGAAQEQMFCDSGIPTSINACHLLAMEEDLKVIFEHQMFEDIVQSNPISINLTTAGDALQVGHKAIFKQTEYNYCMSPDGAGVYDAACNFFLTDPRWNPEHGIPINVVILVSCDNLVPSERHGYVRANASTYEMHVFALVVSLKVHLTRASNYT